MPTSVDSSNKYCKKIACLLPKTGGRGKERFHGRGIQFIPLRASSDLLKPTTASLVFRTLTGTNRCLENPLLRLTHTAETPDVWRWNKLALATYYDILYVSRLFDMRDSGGFPTFHSVLFFSVSMIFGRLCLYKRPYYSLLFPINQSIILIHSFIPIIYFSVHSLDASLSVSITRTVAPLTKVNTTVVTRSP